MVRVTLTFGLLIAVHILSTFCLPKTYLWNPLDLQETKQKISTGQLGGPYKALIQASNTLLTKGPWTVMNKTVTPPSGTKHDYYSLGIYYWPCNWNFTIKFTDTCNETTGLPWINRDGYVNPMTDGGDPLAENHMVDAVVALSLAYFFSGDEKYSERASFVLKYWFLDSATKMDPNLNFGQGIPGVVDGRGSGLIDTRNFALLLNAVPLLEGSKYWTVTDNQQIVHWFTQFLDWMINSTLGVHEHNAKNNHGTWYDVQASSIALFVGDKVTAAKIAQLAMEKRVAVQIEPNGTFPLELARTKSFSYSHFDLQAFFYLASITKYSGVNLFDYVTPDGRSIRKAFEFLLPYALGQKSWPYQQVVSFDRGSFFEQFRIAANAYSDSTYEADISKLPNVSSNDWMVNLLFPKKM